MMVHVSVANAIKDFVSLFVMLFFIYCMVCLVTGNMWPIEILTGTLRLLARVSIDILRAVSSCLWRFAH
jgi:ABC-type multidrug transport system permease subunit